jgi:hypothetical protein
MGTSRKMKVLSVLLVVIMVITGVSLVYFFRPLMVITNEPVYTMDKTSDQHVVVYSVEVNGQNVTVGEFALTWQLNLAENDSEYDYYDFIFHESLRGSAADIGEVGWIEGGRTLVDLRSDKLMIRDASETHGEGAVQATISTNATWNGSVEWRFNVLLGSGSFHPREASNTIHFAITIRAIREADVNLTVYGFSDWSIYGYSFDRILIHGTETIVIDLPSQSGK